MPLLSYTVSDFTPFSKILSADVNSRFTDIKTLLNTTGLDDTNLQNAGITRATKLKAGTAYAVVTNGAAGVMSEVAPGTAGYFLQSAGAAAAPIWAANPIGSQFAAIIGSAAQVTAGTAGYSTYAAAQAAAADGDSILLLNITLVENISMSKRIRLMGLGTGSVVSGTITCATGSSRSIIRDLRATGDVTINAGVEGIVTDIFLASGKTFIDNSDAADVNYLFAMQET